MSHLFSKGAWMCVCVCAHVFACYCVCTVSRNLALKLINHYAQRGSACLCAILCVHLCAREPVCVRFNDLFWWSGVADIEMDGPYALYGPCIFHIPAAKQSRADIAYMARMLHWDVGWLYESSYTHPTALSPLNKCPSTNKYNTYRFQKDTYISINFIVGQRNQILNKPLWPPAVWFTAVVSDACLHDA